MQDQQFSFERLIAYDKSLDLVSWVYILTNKFPKSELFGLSNQVKRAIVSVSSNIAESCGRKSYKEKIHFIEIAYGSLFEAFAQLQIAKRIGYIRKEDLAEIKPAFFEMTRLLTALNNSYKEKI